MPVNQFVDVRLVVDGKPADEICDPDIDDTEDTSTRFVEIQAGQTYKIQVRVLQDFQLRWAPYLCAEVTIDDMEDFFFIESPAANINHHKSYVQEAFELDEINGANIWDSEQGQWMFAQFAFGAFESNEDLNTKSYAMAQDGSNIGTIRVIFFRARKVCRDEPYVDDGHLEALDEAPERFTKGREIKANTKFIATEPITPPRPSKSVYEPIKRKYGRQLEFRFLYRTRAALQNLGLIERDASSPPDHKLRADRAQAMLDDSMAEVKDLKAQLRKLKLEHSAASGRIVTTNSKRH